VEEGFAMQQTLWNRAVAVGGVVLSLSAGPLFAQAPPKIAASAVAQMAALTGIKAAKSPLQSKIDSRLFLALLHRRNDSRLAPLTDFRFLQPEADGRVAVDLAVVDRTGVKPVLSTLESLGAEVKAMSYAYRRIQARVRLDDLETLAAMQEVRKVRRAVPGITQAVISEGDKTHGADIVRSSFGVNGSGVKVCALSDGVDSLAGLQAIGELPAVDILPGRAGAGNEGLGMLEIVHDLAPGATLGFATGGPDEASFAQNILDLAADGCNVILDDLLYLDESPFQDGPVAQAVNTVTAAGVLYFAGAGNDGNKDDLTSRTWEGDFLANGTLPPLSGAGPVHNFGDGGQSILVETGGDPPVLIWAEHYDLATGSASTDFDLYDLNGALTTVFDAGTDTQDGTGGDDFPVEISGIVFAGERLVIARFAAGTTSSVPMLNLILFNGKLDSTLATSGATRGHGAAADAFSIAATPAAASFDGVTPDGPYPGLFTAANESESFTSDGPRRILLSPAGAEITPGNRTSTGGVVRQKPDLTAADGVSTASGGSNLFYGTSAAAPHAAAVAALFKSAQPIATPAQVRAALIGSAIDIEAPGVDRDTGAGIVMANQAIVGDPQSFLSAGNAVPLQVSGDNDAFIESGETWSLTVPLTNFGGITAAGIQAVLTTTTPGVTISVNSSAYPDLPANASANNSTPFIFQVSGVPCGELIRFTMTLNDMGSPKGPQSFPFALKTGAPGTPLTFSYTGPAVAIPDGNDLTGTSPGLPVSASLPIAGVVGNIYDVDFRIDGTACTNAAGATTVGIDHTFVNDLELTLRSPLGTSVLVINHTDGSGNNFCQTFLDEDSGDPSIQSVVTAQAPFTGNFTPNAPLSSFDGESANGIWQLQAQDFFSADTGSVRAFSVIITPAVCIIEDPLPPHVTATKTVTGVPFQGALLTYQIVLTNDGATQPDNPGDEFIDALPASLTLMTATATSGTTVANFPTNTVTWNGSIPAGGSILMTITATVSRLTVGEPIANQGTCHFDADGNGTNESTCLTDDPATAAVGDPTSVLILPSPVEVPALSDVGLALLCLSLAGVALLRLRR
jgi:uncharacterized repeat protein (TIGR01451 family)